MTYDPTPDTRAAVQELLARIGAGAPDRIAEL